MNPDRVPSDYERRVKSLVEKALVVNMGYDFHSDPVPASFGERIEAGKPYVQCATTTRMVPKSCEANIEFEASEIDAEALSNTLRPLGLERRDTIQTAGFNLSPRLRKVGTIDNGFGPNIVRELVVGAPDVPGSVGNLLARHRLDLKQLTRSAEYQVMFRVLFGPLAKHNWWSRHFTIPLVFCGAMGIHPNARPNGPGELVSTMFMIDDRVSKAVEHIDSFAPTSIPGGARLTERAKRQNRWASASAFYAPLSRREPFILRNVEKIPDVRQAAGRTLEHSGLTKLFH